MRLNWTPDPHLPDDRTFGRVTYCAPPWAFEDRHGHIHSRARVYWVGRFDAAAMTNDPVHDGVTTLSPGDSFCDLYVGGDLYVGDDQTGMGWAIPVNTFGTLLQRLKPDGDEVRPGEALFVFSARPPTTVEWWEQREQARYERTERFALRRTLRGSLGAIVRWRWQDYREQRAMRRQGRQDGREALKRLRAEQRDQRRRA